MARISYPLAAVVGFCGACTSLPGELLGTYRVSAHQSDNTCGSTAVYQMPSQYSFELRVDGRTGYFRAAGQPAIQGTYEAPAFNFSVTSAVGESPPDAGTAFCRLVQHETISLSVHRAGDGTIVDADAGASDASVADASDGGDDPASGSSDEAPDLTGEHVLEISADPSTNCVDALAPTGSYERLPCTVRYELTGNLRADF